MYTANKIEHLDLNHHFTMNTEMPMTLYWYFTQYAYVKDYCKDNFAEDDIYPMFIEDCAIALINERHNHPGRFDINYLWDMHDRDFSIKFR